jgi:hypothetical protein
LPETQEYLGKIGIFLLLNSDFPHTKFDFLQQRLSDFQEIQENLLQWLSDFFNGFSLSSTAFRFQRNPRKSSSTAFQYLQRLSDFFNGFPLEKLFIS